MPPNSWWAWLIAALLAAPGFWAFLADQRNRRRIAAKDQIEAREAEARIAKDEAETEHTVADTANMLAELTRAQVAHLKTELKEVRGELVAAVARCDHLQEDLAALEEQHAHRVAELEAENARLTAEVKRLDGGRRH